MPSYLGYGNSPYGYSYGDPTFVALYQPPGTLMSAIANLNGTGGIFIFGTISTTGPLGNFVTFTNGYYAASAHTIQITVSGTAPSACTVSLDGSLDGINWVSLSGNINGTTSSMTHWTEKPVAYIRASVSAYTAGDSTTSVLVTYARGM